MPVMTTPPIKASWQPVVSWKKLDPAYRRILFLYRHSKQYRAVARLSGVSLTATLAGEPMPPAAAHPSGPPGLKRSLGRVPGFVILLLRAMRQPPVKVSSAKMAFHPSLENEAPEGFL